MRIDKLPSVQLINPWSGAAPPDRCWKWSRIRQWAADHIHASNRRAWLAAARAAYRDSDGDTLGSMIIGS